MSDALKTGLILGGAGLAAFLIYQRSQTAVGALAPAGGASSVGGATPGVPSSATASGAPTNGSGSSIGGTITKGVVLAATAPILIPLKVGTAAVHVATSAVKTTAGAAYGAVKSIGSDIASIF